MAVTDALRAYSLIKERIITTRMKPGEMIDEAALVAELGIGRTPIREACKRLEVERLVVVLPRRGMYVAEVTLEELRELEEVRLELEALSARLAVQRITSAQVDDLYLLIEELRDVGDDTPEGLVRLFRGDQRLHALLWRASRNSLLEAECKRLHEYGLRMWYLLSDRLQPSDLHQEFFDEIAAAVRNGDQRRAEVAVRHHIEQFGDALRHHI